MSESNYVTIEKNKYAIQFGILLPMTTLRLHINGNEMSKLTLKWKHDENNFLY